MGLFEMIVLVVLISVVGDVASKAAGRRKRRKATPAPDSGEIAELRQQLELVAEQVDRLTEEQRFLTRLLEERPRLLDHSTSKEAS